jgi:hypothetical protein
MATAVSARAGGLAPARALLDGLEEKSFNQRMTAKHCPISRNIRQLGSVLVLRPALVGSLLAVAGRFQRARLWVFYALLLGASAASFSQTVPPGPPPPWSVTNYANVVTNTPKAKLPNAADVTTKTVIETTCPECMTTQKLKPVKLSRIGNYVTADGLVITLQLTFKCKQVDCKKEFTDTIEVMQPKRPKAKVVE